MRLLSRLTRRRSTLSQCCCSVSNSPTYTPPLFLHVTSLSRTLVLSSLRGTPASWPRTKPKGCVCTCLCVCTCVFVWVWVCLCDVAEDVVIKRIDLAICNTSSSVVRRLTLMEEATAETWLAIYRRSTPSANTHTHTHLRMCNRTTVTNTPHARCSCRQWTRSHQSLRNLLKLSVPVLKQPAWWIQWFLHLHWLYQHRYNNNIIIQYSPLHSFIPIVSPDSACSALSRGTEHFSADVSQWNGWLPPEPPARL